MKVLSLFSGVGGFDMGLENAGMETVFQCEWDKHANSILYKHWPDVPKWDDVSTLTGKHILAHAPVVDVIAWGSPCQDLSVAGKRAGLEGGRSGLFHEGIRIIKELRKETNGQYPRISIWENVVGALNSNRGADFGIILDEMAEAGALAIEWSVLDAQYFGIPQRRRRVFVIAIFDPVLANRCPSPLLPVSESLPGHLAKGKSKGKSAARTLTEGVGADGQWWDGRDTAEALTTTSNEQRMPDKQRFQAVVEQNVVGALAARDYKGVGNQYVAENKLVTEPAIVFNDDRRIGPTIHGNTVSTLQAFMGTGGNNTPMVAHAIPIQDGRDIEKHQNGLGIAEVGSPAYTLDQTGAQAVAYSIREDAKADNFSATELDHANSLSALQPSPQSHHAQMFIVEPTLAFDTQFGSNANVTENVSPTLKSSQQSPRVAYPIDTRNALRDPEKYDAQNRQGLGIGNDGDPMATLTSAHVNAVAYDEYNDTTNEVHHALRAGTKPSTGVLLGNEVAATLRSGGDGGVPSSRGEHLVVSEAAGFKAGQGAQSRSIGYQEGMAQTLTSDMNGLEPTVLTPTMAVRRLTPLECERLMGWPDDHTRYKADGTEQADTHRYKQCGNGVASPVAQWIAKHILAI